MDFSGIQEIFSSNKPFWTKILTLFIQGMPGLFVGVIASAMRIAKDRKPLKEMLRTSLLCTGAGFITAISLGDLVKDDKLMYYISSLFIVSFCAEYLLDFIPKFIIFIINEYLGDVKILKIFKSINDKPLNEKPKNTTKSKRKTRKKHK